ncbi:MAG: HAMP domain-containing protein [Anaerolineae bacterium]|nr:HAMP domain-containing protein [Anaerolineae bacterium]
MALERSENYLTPQFSTHTAQLLAYPPYARNGKTHPLPQEADFPLVTSPVTPPTVKVPVRIKITLPYFVLALLVAMAGAYIVSRVVLDSIEERFTNQLIEAGQLATDQMVQEESRLLETWRLLAHTQNLAGAITRGDAEQLHRLTLPVAVNYQEEAIEILNAEGTAVLSLRHPPGGQFEDYRVSQGDTSFAGLPFVQQVLQRRVDEAGDKFTGLVRVAGQAYLYVAGPIVNEQGDLAGVLLVGKSLPTLVQQIKQETLGHVTLYNFKGQLIASTLPSFNEDTPDLEEAQVKAVLVEPNNASGLRRLAAGSINYTEMIGPWQVRAGQKVGLMGIALAQTSLVHASQFTRLQIFILVTLTFLLTIGVGVYLANRITHPLLRMVQASTEVAQGNLDVQVESAGNDEVAVLSHAFNQMISGLREGSLYRDILGRTVSPEIREELRQAFAAGTLQLKGQGTVATVLISDIRDFTVLSEKEDPTTVLNWLNEYFSELVPIITAHGGVVNGFQGDALLAFFGILPRPLPPQESADQACRAALDMLKAIQRLNARRIGRGEPPLITGIGINTGLVTAGGLGSTDRLHYTIIGDTVNTTQRIEDLTRQLGESGAIVSQQTKLALRKKNSQHHLEPLGAKILKGKSDPLLVYRLYPAGEAVAMTEAVS